MVEKTMKLGQIIIIVTLFLTVTIAISIPSYNPNSVLLTAANKGQPTSDVRWWINGASSTEAAPTAPETTTQVDNVALAAQAAATNIGKPMGFISTTTNEDMLNATTALSDGVKGVIILNMDNSTQIPINTVQGVGKTIVLTAKFVPYDKGIAEAIMTLNPQDPGAIVVGRGLGDGKGSIIKLNDFVKYSVDHVELPANQIVKITMTINIPVGTPHTTIPLAPVGISSDYPIINNISGDVNL